MNTLDKMDTLIAALSLDTNTIRNADDRQEVCLRLLRLVRANKVALADYEDVKKLAHHILGYMRRERAIHARILAYHARMVQALGRDDRVWDDVDKRLSVERLPISLREFVAPIQYGVTVQELAQAHNVSVRTIQRRLAEARELLV
jgi:DNA-directed RNA polymerase specialized sigma24 family protein